MRDGTQPLILAVLVALATQAPQLRAETHRIPRVDAECRIDGELTEPAWDLALVVPYGIEVEPAENVPAPVDTEVRLYYTETQICASFVARATTRSRHSPTRRSGSESET